MACCVCLYKLKKFEIRCVLNISNICALLRCIYNFHSLSYVCCCFKVCECVCESHHDLWHIAKYVFGVFMWQKVFRGYINVMSSFKRFRSATVCTFRVYYSRYVMWCDICYYERICTVAFPLKLFTIYSIFGSMHLITKVFHDWEINVKCQFTVNPRISALSRSYYGLSIHWWMT